MTWATPADFVPSLDWYRRKCRAYSDAWVENYGARPGRVNVALAVSVATHETRAGDAWPGEDGIVGTDDDENNWGATTLRALNDAERFALATDALERLIAAGVGPRDGEGWERLFFDSFKYTREALYLRGGLDVIRAQRALEIKADGKWGPKSEAAFLAAFGPDLEPEDLFPDVDARYPLTEAQARILLPMTPSVAKGHAARATEAMAVLRRAFLHTGYALPQAVIHCDSTPEHGAYFVWFARFMSEKDGAKYFQKLLAGLDKPKAARAVLERGGTPYELAAAMYGAGYYTGFKEKNKVYEDGRTGRELNIAAYTDRIQAHYPSAYAAAA